MRREQPPVVGVYAGERFCEPRHQIGRVRIAAVGDYRAFAQGRHRQEDTVIVILLGVWIAGTGREWLSGDASTDSKDARPKTSPVPAAAANLKSEISDLKLEEPPPLEEGLKDFSETLWLLLAAFCNQAVCAPSRNSLLTGLRPQTIGIYDLPTNFRKGVPDAVTMAQYFRQRAIALNNFGVSSAGVVPVARAVTAVTAVEELLAFAPLP
jgi:hypothetical protein